MSIRESIQIGHPALKSHNFQVDRFDAPHIQQLIADLTDTMRDGGLVGMAAPQIAENYTVFVTEPRQTEARPLDQSDELRVYINPLIVGVSEEEIIMYEGCGSVLKGLLFGPVMRPKIITIEAINHEGKKFRLRCDGLLARVIQHENDHLHGIEFTEKISDYKLLLSREFYIERVKGSPEQLENSNVTIKEVEWL